MSPLRSPAAKHGRAQFTLRSVLNDRDNAISSAVHVLTPPVFRRFLWLLRFT